jgi:nicotinate-nucleotide adenylyltransferase
MTWEFCRFPSHLVSLKGCYSLKKYQSAAEIEAEMQRHRIGLIGGTFDPVHFGHLVVAEEIYYALALDEIVFIPAGEPPHKRGQIVTPAAERLAMLELAIAPNAHFSISRVDLDRPGPSYTVDTLRLLREQWGDAVELYFVIGWDSLEDLASWYDPQGILKQLDYLVAVHRPGHQELPGYRERLEARLPGIKQRLLTVPVPQLDISASELRQRVAGGRPIRYQTPDAVVEYIREHNVYREQS